MSQQIVEKLGFWSFIVMTTLILVCIAFGFWAVYQAAQTPDWQTACIQAGGVPVQLEKHYFDCKGIN